MRVGSSRQESQVSLAGQVHLFLMACDAVKFARHVPAPKEKDGTVDQAYKILDAARPRPAPAEIDLRVRSERDPEGDAA